MAAFSCTFHVSVINVISLGPSASLQQIRKYLSLPKITACTLFYMKCIHETDSLCYDNNAFVPPISSCTQTSEDLLPLYMISLLPFSVSHPFLLTSLLHTQTILLARNIYIFLCCYHVLPSVTIVFFYAHMSVLSVSIIVGIVLKGDWV